MPAGDYCSGWKEYYGMGRWTYSQIEFCLTYDTTKTTKVKIKTQDAQYHWGGAWYKANTRTIAQHNTGSVDGTAFSGGSGTITSPGSWTIDTGAYYGCGAHTLAIQATSAGPYWGADAEISIYASFPITVC